MKPLQSLQNLIIIGVTFSLICANIQIVSAQFCSPESYTAKYWQYRKDFKEHFIVNDRDSNGCIGNGITTSDTTIPEKCGMRFLNGRGIPATSVIMSPNGSNGLDRRNVGTPWEDLDCAGFDDGDPLTTNDDISWDFSKHNYLEFGSETPHQMGWYWITLASEYALLIQNGQEAEAKRTLEDLFLGLQAYRRLDMLANCIAKERYDEITNDFEVENCTVGLFGGSTGDCLVGKKYTDGSIGQAHQDDFDTPCDDNCPWQPDLSGYSGFFLREDAVQDLEALHDPSEDKWNIDLIGSSFAMSNQPPCSTTFSQACWLAGQQNFISQDQAFALMMGLTFVKKYIPETAWVTTCNGDEYNVLDIAQSIAEGIAKVADNFERRIYWPGADECCTKNAHISTESGGNLTATYAGMIQMRNYICDEDENIRKRDKLIWNAFGDLGIMLGEGETVFYLEGTAFGTDIGQMSNLSPGVLNLGLAISPIGTIIGGLTIPAVAQNMGPTRSEVINALDNFDKEIFGLANNLLFPAEPNVPTNREEFEQMLCDAPCGGTCFKPLQYYSLHDTNPDWPHFECANTPGWTGQRWEGGGGSPNWGASYQARQFNGLDFMALYNLYMLHYPQEQTAYYNPDRPEFTNQIHFLGEDKIQGPTTLCPGFTGYYNLLGGYTQPSMQNLIWSGSQNLNIATPIINGTNALMVSALTPTYIEASLEKVRGISRWINGVEQQEIVDSVFVDVGHGSNAGYWEYTWEPITNNDVCEETYRKPILNEAPVFDIVTEIDPCHDIFSATAEGPFNDNVVLNWTASENVHNHSITGQDNTLDFSSIIPFNSTSSIYVIVTLTLDVQSPCGNRQIVYTHGYYTCPPHEDRQIKISPNPTPNVISIRVMQNEITDFITTDPNGIRIQIYPATGGSATLLDSYLYGNGQTFNVAFLTNGIYQVRASASDFVPPVHANFTVIH